MTEYNNLRHFVIGADIRWRSYEDAAPVPYDGTPFVACVAHTCHWLVEVTPDMNLEDVVDEAEAHWFRVHMLRGRDL